MTQILLFLQKRHPLCNLKIGFCSEKSTVQTKNKSKFEVFPRNKTLEHKIATALFVLKLFKQIGLGMRAKVATLKKKTSFWRGKNCRGHLKGDLAQNREIVQNKIQHKAVKPNQNF